MLSSSISTLILFAVVGAVVVAGAVIWNFQRMEKQNVNSVTRKISPAEYHGEYFVAAQAHTLVDVRTPEEFRSGHIPGAINIELDNLAQRLAEIPQDKPAILYCRSGRRSQMGAAILAQSGYTEIANLGGIVEWQHKGLPIQ